MTTPANPSSDVSAIAPPGPGGTTLRASFAACAQVTRSRARNFYYGLRLAPEPKRSALYAIYAWMREADDAVDDAADADDARSRLDGLVERTQGVLAGTGHGLAGIWPAVAHTIRSYSIEASWLDDMLEGMRSDIGGVAIEDEDALSLYCYRVAGVAGLCCLAVWGLRDGADRATAERLALARGQAFQRTNILRDLGEDLRAEPPRCYVPRDVLDRHGLDVAALGRWSDEDRCRGLVVEWADDAAGWFERSAGLESLVDPACAPVCRAMSRIYRGILDRAARRPRSVIIGPRPAVPTVQKLVIAARGAFERAVSR